MPHKPWIPHYVWFLSDIAGVLALAYFLLIALFGMYAVLMLYFTAGWRSTPETHIQKEYEPKTNVSVLIPARNEALNLPNLLADLRAQIFPPHLWEIIVIDDLSTDDTVARAKQFSKVRVLSLAEYMQDTQTVAYKKKAIQTGIQESDAPWIITLDADVRVGPWWLHSMVQHCEENMVQWLAGPVQFPKPKTWFERFQLFDFLTMQGITAALLTTRSGIMCNGANLAYARSAFEHVNGFEGIDGMASGDDMLLMQKMDQVYPGESMYVKNAEAIATTHYMPSMHDFIQQRIRWASKAKFFSDWKIKAILLIVFLCNLMWFVFPLFCYWGILSWKICIPLMVAQVWLEWRLLSGVLKFFRQQASLLSFIILKGLHVPYILISGFWGMFGSYTWKERNVH